MIRRERSCRVRTKSLTVELVLSLVRTKTKIKDKLKLSLNVSRGACFPALLSSLGNGGGMSVNDFSLSCAIAMVTARRRNNEPAGQLGDCANLHVFTYFFSEIDFALLCILLSTFCCCMLTAFVKCFSRIEFIRRQVIA